MFKRDNEAEGTFGDLKENMGYDRLYRRGLVLRQEKVPVKLRFIY